MLCEKCRQREARVKITKVINGVSETHNLCPECAKPFGILENGGPGELSKAIFRLLSESAKDNNAKKDQEAQEEKQKLIECPNCGKTYGEFLEDGIFGCPDCYEAFTPPLDRMILSMQGADSHTGKKSLGALKKPRTLKDVTREVLTPEQETELLQMKLNEAVSAEDYDTAAKLRDQIRALQHKETQEASHE
jgi:protein arginine kinase activator